MAVQVVVGVVVVVREGVIVVVVVVIVRVAVSVRPLSAVRPGTGARVGFGMRGRASGGVIVRHRPHSVRFAGVDQRRPSVASSNSPAGRLTGLSISPRCLPSVPFDTIAPSTSTITRVPISAVISDWS